MEYWDNKYDYLLCRSICRNIRYFLKKSQYSVAAKLFALLCLSSTNKWSIWTKLANAYEETLRKNINYSDCSYWATVALINLCTNDRIYPRLLAFTYACSDDVADFNTYNKLLTQKLLKQGYRYHKLRKTFSKFHRRYYDLLSKFQLNSKLDFNLSCAKDFRNLNSMVTWCINWNRLLALIFI